MALLGVLAVASMLIANLSPAEDKHQRSLDVSIADIAPGTYKVVHWFYQPIAVFRTSPEVLEKLRVETSLTASRRPIPTPGPAAFVYSLVSTNLGCSVKESRDPRYPGDDKWPGGFYDPCHYGEWDYAGRTLDLGNLPKEMLLPDLRVPNYEWVSDQTIRLLPRT
jgi:ubiquinol-cytochrome c reductase iron-sulfur subunit